MGGSASGQWHHHPISILAPQLFCLREVAKHTLSHTHTHGANVACTFQRRWLLSCAVSATRTASNYDVNSLRASAGQQAPPPRALTLIESRRERACLVKINHQNLWCWGAGGGKGGRCQHWPMAAAYTWNMKSVLSVTSTLSITAWLTVELSRSSAVRCFSVFERRLRCYFWWMKTSLCVGLYFCRAHGSQGAR